jgi:hypothetical protein
VDNASGGTSHVVSLPPVLTGSGRNLRRAVLAFAALLSVAACAGNNPSGPHSLPALTLKAPVSLPGPLQTSAGPAAPAVEGPRKAELATAAAVVRRYYALFNAPTTFQTARAIQGLVEHSCPCLAVAKAFRKAAGLGEHFVGTGRLLAVRPTFDSRSLVDVVVSYDATRGGLVGPLGNYLSHVATQHDVTQQLWLVRAADRWRIERVLAVSKGR